MKPQPKSPSATPHTDHPLKKPAIILVHGFRGSPIGLEAIAAGLRQHGYLVHIPAIPPFGGAKKLPEYTPEAYAHYLKDYIREQKLTQPILIGHSMGSIIVAAMISIYPKLVNKRSVLLSPISNRAAAPFRVLSPLTAMLPRKIVDFITTTYLFVPHDRALLHQVLEITHHCSNDQPPRRSEVLNVATFSTRYCVGDFSPSQDLLILAGEKDRLISKKQTLKLADKIQAKTEFLSDCGHLHNYEKPQETVDKIINFLEENGN